MKFEFTCRFKRSYRKLPQEIQKQFSRKLILFQKNFNHPSLRIEKLKGTFYWAGTIDMNYRFIFKLETGACVFMNIGSHKILDKF